jgi:hypothetical protein
MGQALVALPKYPSYPLNIEPLKRFPDVFQRFEDLRKKFEVDALSEQEHRERMALIEKVLVTQPEWQDGYWLLAADSFFLGSNVMHPSDHPGARRDLVQGREALERCMKLKPDHLLCRFLYASIKAKIASIDGIFSSLKHGRTVKDIWLSVVKSPYDMSFRPNVTMQGAARFALGLFYRLVPDSIWVQWIWGIRGNIDTSIRYHRESLELDPRNPCARLMLAVALLCKVQGEAHTPQFGEAMSLLQETAREPSIDLAQAVCVKDAPLIAREPMKTCGYTQAKYQDEIPEEKLREKRRT